MLICRTPINQSHALSPLLPYPPHFQQPLNSSPLQTNPQFPQMALKFPLLFLLLLLLQTSPSLQQQNSLSQAELQALVDIRRSLRDLPGSKFFRTWDFTASADPCASFSGVVCSLDPSDSSTLRVTALTLGTGLSDSPGLTGILSDSIASLAALAELVVYPGRIAGSIPSLIGDKCRDLRLVSISNNLISGEIPESFTSLAELHTLDLSHNRLTGTIPAPLFSSLTNLKVLILASNSLSGMISPSLSSTSLLHLDLSYNSLTGTLPPLPQTLRYLSLAKNSLSGPLNAAFSSQLSNLTYIDLSMNKFCEKIPTTVFTLPQVYVLLLQRNNFSGPLILPETVPAWEVVDVSHNVISGEVPAELAAAESLFLNSNKLTGAVPVEIVRRVFDGSMTTFYAQHNFLTVFPSTSLEPLPESVSVCLAYNCLVLPAGMEAGCPASAGTLEARPAEQCPNYG